MITLCCYIHDDYSWTVSTVITEEPFPIVDILVAQVVVPCHLEMFIAHWVSKPATSILVEHLQNAILSKYCALEITFSQVQYV